MITIKNKASLRKMAEAGKQLALICRELETRIRSGVSTLALDAWIDQELTKRGLKSKTKGFKGYRHASCISINDVVVHGVPSADNILKDGDMVTVDICASWEGYCADMARTYFVGEVPESVRAFVAVAQVALDKGIAQAREGNRLSDISAAIQIEVERHGYGVVRDFAGHGIGKQLHEEPEVLNYGPPGKGPVLRAGMTLAIEPMITMGKYDVYITTDGWTVKTKDRSLAAHVEDTIAITQGDPVILTRTT
jgi:methionyl aminopeptidase